MRHKLAIVGAVQNVTPKRRIRNITDVCVPFQLEVVSKSAAQNVNLIAAPQRGLPRKFWQPAEIERLIELAAIGMVPALIAVELNRSESSVRHAARYRNIALTPIPNDERRSRNNVRLIYKRRKWTNNDVALLRKMAKGGSPASKVATRLERSAAVKLYAKNKQIKWRSSPS